MTDFSWLLLVAVWCALNLAVSIANFRDARRNARNAEANLRAARDVQAMARVAAQLNSVVRIDGGVRDERLARVVRDLKRRHGGTGLGLS